MDYGNIVDFALIRLAKGGAALAGADLRRTEKSELNVDAGKVSLFRSTAETALTLTAIVGGGRGTVTVGGDDTDSVALAVDQALTLAASAAPDPANDIAPKAAARFEHGPLSPDAEGMYDRLAEFVAYSGATYPYTKLEQCIFDFTKTERIYRNSNGADFSENSGIYKFSPLFTTKKGAKTSSFNYSEARRKALDAPLAEWGSIDTLLRQSAGQLDPKSLSGSFTGDIIITPDFMTEIVGMLEDVFLGERCLVSGKSPWRDSLGRRVAASGFSLRSCPRSGLIADGNCVTQDGFEAADCAILEDGILREFLLGLYGSNKTGKRRTPSGSGGWIVDPGRESLEDLVASVERGILLCRFSGGMPDDSGDFSGVAKNSYHIEHGKIVGPICETMVSGNLASLLESISGISRERVDFGTELYPWVKSGGVTISGR